MTALYNEHDAYPAAWLRSLIAAGHIAPGTVDERSIVDLEPADLAGVTQFHAFAGIGVWSHALRLAGVPDDAPVWTGSCPCQPFSVAGKRKGADDSRHLWPAWFRLIRECRPAIVFGEQVDGPAGLAWLDAVHADLEGCGYAVGAAVIPAAGVGAPHRRHRIYFVADAQCDPRVEGRPTDQPREGSGAQGAGAHAESGRRGRPRCAGPDADGGLSGHGGLQPGGEHGLLAQDHGPRLAEQPRLEGQPGHGDHGPQPRWIDKEAARSLAEAGATRGFWSPADWWIGLDGKARPIGPGLLPLAYGATARLGRLRAYGNAIIPHLAAAFIRAALQGDS